MSNIYPLPSQKLCYDEASRWIERLSEGLSASEEKELKAWLAADSQNEAVFLKMAEMWDKMNSLGRLASLFPEPAVRTSRSPIRARSWCRPALAVAAAMVIAIAGGWIVLNDLPAGPSAGPPIKQAETSPAESVYETAIGEQSTVTLMDGTRLTLNTNSRVRVDYAPNYRLLLLETGEIHVKVAKDPSRPLSVIAGDNIVQAVGTEFNVEITQSDRIELVVTEGKVRVGVRPHEKAVTQPIEPIVLPDSSETVAAGEQLVLGESQDATSPTPISDSEIQVKLSWREGNLIFRGEPLEKTVAEVGRYTAVEFVILDEDLKKIRVSGFFKAGDVDGMLAALEENFDISYERVGENRVLLSSP